MEESIINYEESQVAATLSAIAYLRGSTQSETFTKMAKALQQANLPTKQQWSLVWGPVTNESDLMFIAQGPLTGFGRKYAVVIRGTIWTLESIMQDLELSPIDLPWSDPNAPEGVKISTGIGHAFNRLRSMTQNYPRGVMSALDFLRNLKGQNEIIVTGHSLGGCLASVVPLWLKTEFASKGTAIRPYTFAGQCAGNQSFANYFAFTFPQTTRYYNVLDIVPKLWNTASLVSIRNLYPGSGPKCDDFWDALIDVAIYEAGNNYFQPNNGYELKGKVYDEKGDFEFTKEAMSQHSHIYYMYLTGIPLNVIQGTPFNPGLGSGWWPPEIAPVYKEEYSDMEQHLSD